MQIALSLNLCIGRCEETEMIPRLAGAGFEGLDFNFCDIPERLDWTEPGIAEPFLDGLKESAANNKLEWVQAHGPMFSMFADTPKDRHRRSLVVPAMRACARLGAPWMVLHPGTLPGPFDREHRGMVLQKNVEFFRSLLGECEKHNVGIAVENGTDPPRSHARTVARSFGSVPEDLCDLIDELDHPLVGICWDTGHAHLMGLDQRSAIASLGNRLKVLHIAENDGLSDLHMMPFACIRGVEWEAVTDGLRLVGFRGAFTYEGQSSLRSLPDAILDHALRYYAGIARYLAEKVMRS